MYFLYNAFGLLGLGVIGLLGTGLLGKRINNNLVALSLFTGFTGLMLYGLIAGLYTHATKERIGAVCNDGSKSEAISSGACSYHGGVDEWVYVCWYDKKESTTNDIIYGGSSKGFKGIEISSWLYGKKDIPFDYSGLVAVCKKGAIESLAEYENGRKNGFSRHWYPNGNLREEYYYKKGELDGKSRKWSSEGTIYEECYYLKGKRHGMLIKYFPNGRRECEQNFKFGKKHGKGSSFYSNGNVNRVAHYEEGLLNGMHVRGHSNGQLWYAEEFVNDTIVDGPVVYRDESGKKYGTYFYKNGLVVRIEGEIAQNHNGPIPGLDPDHLSLRLLFSPCQ